MRKLLPIILLLSISANAEIVTLTPSDDASVRDGINSVNEKGQVAGCFLLKTKSYPSNFHDEKTNTHYLIGV